MKKNKKAPRASKRSKRKKKYEEKLSTWFTISIFLLILIALVIFFINEVETKDQKIVASVNGGKITVNELENWYKISINPEFRSVISKEDFLVESLIPQIILMQQAEKENILVSKDDVEAELGQFLIDSGLNLEDLKKELKEDDTNIDYVREAFRQRLVINKLLEQKVISEILVSNSEVNEIFQDTKSFDPALSSEGVKQVIYGQLLKRKQSDAVEYYINGLVNEAEVEMFADDKSISFSETKDKICELDGKPIVRLYTTTDCGPCRWINKRIDNVMKNFDGQIAAFHWQLDTGDNTLTEETEKGIPKEEMEVFRRYNGEGTVPTYVFGCKYVRIGNFYEKIDDLDAEEEEFRNVIGKILGAS